MVQRTSSQNQPQATSNRARGTAASCCQRDGCDLLMRRSAGRWRRPRRRLPKEWPPDRCVGRGRETSGRHNSRVVGAKGLFSAIRRSRCNMALPTTAQRDTIVHRRLATWPDQCRGVPRFRARCALLLQELVVQSHGLLQPTPRPQWWCRSRTARAAISTRLGRSARPLDLRVTMTSDARRAPVPMRAAFDRRVWSAEAGSSRVPPATQRSRSRAGWASWAEACAHVGRVPARSSRA